MSENYSILVRDADKREKHISELEDLGFERVQLPDNMVLLVDDDAPEEIKNAAQDAANGDFDALQIALGDSQE
jgi:hypothetical protein